MRDQIKNDNSYINLDKYHNYNDNKNMTIKNINQNATKFDNQRISSEKYEKLKYDYNLRMSSGVLLLLNCPSLMQFGIDYSRWKIGEKFMGIKLIPIGAHYISYSLSDEDYAIKQGFFININKNMLIHIRKWDNELEDFIILKEEDEKNFSIGLNNLDFDAYLGSYPFEQYDDWKDLTNYITIDVIDKIQPISKKFITTSKEYDEITDRNEKNLHLNKNKENLDEMLKLKHLETYKEENKFFEDKSKIKKNINKFDSEIIPNIESDSIDIDKEIFINDNIVIDMNDKEKIEKQEKTKTQIKKKYESMQEKLVVSLASFDNLKSDLYFTEIPKKKIFLSTEKIDYSILTKNNIDKSFLFEELLFKSYKGNECVLLGEFQFSFITFFLAEIYESFQHWRDLCLLILNCQDVVSKNTNFFCTFIEVLYNQLRQFPKDFFEDEISSNNFFRKALENFISYIRDNENNNIFPENSKIKKIMSYFEKFLNELFGFFVKDEKTKIIEKYLNMHNQTQENLNFEGYCYGNLNKRDEDDEMPVIVDEEEINQILQNGNSQTNNNYDYSNTNNNIQIETGDNTIDNTDTDFDDNDNMNIDRF